MISNIGRRSLLLTLTTLSVIGCSSTPVIQSVTASPTVIAPNGTVTITVVASESNSPLTYSWTPPMGWTVVGTKTNEAALALKAPAQFGQSAVVGVTVSDGGGNKVSSQIAISTASDLAPVISSLKLAGGSVAPGGTVALVAVASSPTGQSLTYTWTSSDSKWTVNDLGNGVASIKAPSVFSTSTILSLVVTDAAGLTASDSAIITTTPDQAPVIGSVTASANVIAPGASATLAAVATSPTGIALTYTWTSSNPLWQLAGNAGSATVTAPSLFSSSTVVSVTATDTAGLSATNSVELATSANAAPIISTLKASPNPTQPGGAVTLVVAATSPTGSTLSYTWQSSDPTWNISGNGNTATIIAPSTLAATTVVSVVVTDATNLQASDSIAVSTEGDSPPVINALSASPNPAPPQGTITVAVGATSPSNSVLFYNWKSSNPAWTVTGSGSTATVNAPNVFSGITVITVVATDTSNLQATDSIVVSTSAAPQPQISLINWTPNNPTAGQTVTLSAVTNLNSLGAAGATYAWSLTSSPSGSSAALSSPAVATPSFIADVAGSYQAALVVTSAGVSSTPATATITVGLPAPQAVISGTLTGAINTTLALSSNGSSAPNGNPLTYLWTIFSAPVVGSSAAFFADAAAITPGSTVAAPFFKSNQPGVYTVGLQVTDQITHQLSTATAQVTLLAPAAITWVSGSSQTATVNTFYAQPFVFKVTASDTTPLAGIQVQYSVSNGSATTLSTKTDNNGQVSFSVRAGRIAQVPGAIFAWLGSDKSKTAHGSFTLTSDQAAYIALLSPGVLANADTNVPVTVSVVDQYGNLSTTNAVADQTQVTLAVTSPSGHAMLQSGATTGTTLNAVPLVNGQVSVSLIDTTAEAVQVTMTPVSAGTQVLPYATWQTIVYDSGQAQYPANSGWFSTLPVVGSAPPYSWIITPDQSKANTSKVTAYDLTVLPSELAFSGTAGHLLNPTVPTLPSGASASSNIFLAGFVHNASVGTAFDTTTNCNAQPALYATMVQSPSESEFLGESGQNPVIPLGGYPTLSTCSGHASFATTTTAGAGTSNNTDTVANAAGWVPAEYDVTDAVAQGYLNLTLNVGNSPDASEINQAATWYVDDVWTSSFVTLPLGTAASAPVTVLPGAAKQIAFSGSSAAVFGACATTPPVPNFTVNLIEEDNFGNTVPQDAIPGLPSGTLSWLAAIGKVTPVGTSLSNPLTSTPVSLALGVGSIAFTSQNIPANGQVTFNFAVNPPSTVPTPPAYQLKAFCHSDGQGAGGPSGGQWQDLTPLSSLTSEEALNACQTFYGAGNCAVTSIGQAQFTYPAVGAANYGACGCSSNFDPQSLIWAYGSSVTSFTNICGGSFTMATGSVTSILWLGSCSCCTGGTPGDPTQADPLASSGTWN